MLRLCWVEVYCCQHLFSLSQRFTLSVPSMNNRIKEFRAREGLTQQDLARLVDVRRETIVFLEKGKYNPSLKLAHDISKVFKLTIEDVFQF